MRRPTYSPSNPPHCGPTPGDARARDTGAPDPDHVARTLAALRLCGAVAPATLADVAAVAGLPPRALLRSLGALLKLGEAVADEATQTVRAADSDAAAA